MARPWNPDVGASTVTPGAGPELGRCFVTGAAGFFGRHLVQGLLDSGCRVRALIRNTPLTLTHPNLEIVKGSIDDAHLLTEQCVGIDTVFHTAAQVALLGGRAVTKAYRQTAYAANVAGTQNVVAACRANNVGRLIHTSSIDVCFDGTENTEMDQSTPYASTFTSVYSETKIEAEKVVLDANDQDGLRTVALRPSGIYGAASNVMMDELFRQLKQGKFIATMGYPGGIHDHIFVDNLTHTHLLAAKAMAQSGAPCGKAYFIGDGQAQPIFEFFRPFIEGLGYAMPKRDIPIAPLLAAMRVQQYLHFKLGLPEPTLAPHEILKMSVSHHGDNRAAERDLCYSPVRSRQEGIAEALTYYRSRLDDHSRA